MIPLLSKNLDLNLGPLEYWGDTAEPGSGYYPNSAFKLIGINVLQPGEGIVFAKKITNAVSKTLENGNGYLEDEDLGKKEKGEKNRGDEVVVVVPTIVSMLGDDGNDWIFQREGWESGYGL
ncbi:Hypothetical predicted protein [Olea europaea subsp. europaea]|uniref:Uncharacterized protein n=1 Tax=Olea europaea subsp. europaea TaxID=158383 RepID=A0A8S0U3P4_OLEEU|nr:Hypothetical predicted protein [Olea europaea subsp. europaea]